MSGDRHLWCHKDITKTDFCRKTHSAWQRRDCYLGTSPHSVYLIWLSGENYPRLVNKRMPTSDLLRVHSASSDSELTVPCVYIQLTNGHVYKTKTVCSINTERRRYDIKGKIFSWRLFKSKSLQTFEKAYFSTNIHVVVGRRHVATIYFLQRRRVLTVHLLYTILLSKENCHLWSCDVNYLSINAELFTHIKIHHNPTIVQI